MINEFGLTPEEELFAIEFFTTKNATQSFKKAYPKSSYAVASNKGYLLRDKPEVQAYLKFLMDTVRNDRIMTAEEVLVGISDMARGEDTELAKHQKIYSKDKVKALELLAKHYLLLTEVSKQEIEQKIVFVDDLGGEVENGI